jgi:hypothetical protein
MLYALLIAFVVIALIAIVPVMRARRRPPAAQNETASVPPPAVEVGAAATGPERDVRFTVFRPGAVTPKKWYTVLVFMHEAEAPQDTLPEDLPAEEQVRREAARILGEESHAYVSAAEDSAQPVPIAGQLLFAVELPGFEVNPPAQHIAWLEAIQDVRFRIRAGDDLTGKTARGRLSIYRGPLLLAEMTLVIRVGVVEEEPVREPVKTYRKIFASYSRLDEPIVRQVEAVASAIGDTWLRDVHSLRSGEQWNPALARLIEDADVFQLFWSWNSLESDMVRREWLHAIGLNRSNFIRPVYWEDPFPCRPERDLPPAELSEIQFSRLPSAVVPAAKPAAIEAKALDAPTFESRLQAAAPQPAPTLPAPQRAPTLPAPDSVTLGGGPPPKRPFRFGRWLSTAALVMLAVSGVVMSQRLGVAPDAEGPSPTAAQPEDVPVQADPVVAPPPPPPPTPVIIPPTGRGAAAGRGAGAPRPTAMPPMPPDDGGLRRLNTALAARDRSAVVLFPEAERAEWAALFQSRDVRTIEGVAGRPMPLDGDSTRATAPYLIVIERNEGERTTQERVRYIAHLRAIEGDWTVERLERIPG